ncbi:MAG: nucleotidyltransferase family protein [Eubacterium sp.]
MDKESVYLIKLLKSFILCENPGVFNGNWIKLIQLAESHSVSGIVGYMVMTYPDESNAAAADSLRVQYLQTISSLTQRDENMKIQIRQMNERGIDHLLFKGYILKDYYPIPELRTFGDIDFLIHPQARKLSDELMLELGFQRKTDWEPVYSYSRQNEYYEIHTDVMEVDVSDKADYKGYFSHIWEHAHCVDGHTWELSPEYHFLYLLTHIAKHINGSGAGIRMYMDIACFIRHFENELDWKYIQREIQTLCFNDFANIVLTVVQECFGVKSPIPLREVEQTVFADFMEFTMAGGTFGFAGRDAGLISLKAQNRNDEKISRVGTFVQRLFPSASKLEKRYTYLEGRHLLLPIAWVHRLFRTKADWGKHTKEAHSIMNTDAEEVLKLKRIYKEIGL